MFSITFDIETSFNIYPTVILFGRMHWTNSLINNILITYKMLEQNPQDFFLHNVSFLLLKSYIIKKQYFLCLLLSAMIQPHKAFKDFSFNMFFIVSASI